MRMSNMIESKNAFEIFNLLEKSNYGEKTCFAFAGAAFKRQRRIAECPQLDPNVITRYSEGGDSSSAREPEGTTYCQKLKDAVAGVDLSAATKRVRGHIVNGRQTLKVLGKNVGVDPGT
jgi:hypothetical protein